MKILHLAATLAPTGGTEIYLRSLFQPLRELGHENVIASVRHSAETQLGLSERIYMLQQDRAQHLGRIIDDENPDLVFINGIVPPVCIRESARRAPTVAYVHDFHPVCPGLAKFFRVSRQVCARRIGTGCISKIYFERCASARNPANVLRILNAAQEYLGAYRALPRVLVASGYMADLLSQNDINPERITILPQYTTVVADEAAPVVPGRPPLILFAGRLEPEKGLDLLISALERVTLPWRLAIAGEGTQRATLAARIAQLGWTDRVHFHGWLNEVNLNRLYAEASIVAVPSAWPEPFGRVGLDGLAHGRPVVAYNVGGISSWLKDERSGYLVPSQDQVKFAERLETLLANPALAEEFGRQGAQDARENFSPKRHFAALQEIFNGLARVRT